MRAPRQLLSLLLACSTITACQAITQPAADLSGIYTLTRVDGPADVQGVGTLVISTHGYAERRIRYREPDNSLSREWLATGEAEIRSDSTIAVEFRDIDPKGMAPWHPEVRMIRGGIELVRYGAGDGTRIVETYTRK